MSKVWCTCGEEDCTVLVVITGELYEGAPVIFFRAYDEEGRRGNQCVPAQLLRDWLASQEEGGNEFFEYESEDGSGRLTIDIGELTIDTVARGVVSMWFEAEGMGRIVEELDKLEAANG